MYYISSPTDFLSDAKATIVAISCIFEFLSIYLAKPVGNARKRQTYELSAPLAMSLGA